MVLEYLTYLESVYLIDRVKRTEIEGRKIFEIGDKFYFEDMGMRHAIVPFQQKDISKVLENMVYHHLIVTGHTVFVGKHGDKEIDFVAYKDEIKSYVQVAYLIPDEKHISVNLATCWQFRITVQKKWLAWMKQHPVVLRVSNMFRSADF